MATKTTAVMCNQAWSNGCKTVASMQKYFKDTWGVTASYQTLYPHWKKLCKTSAEKVTVVPMVTVPVAPKPIDKEAKMAEFMEKMEDKWREAFALVKKTDEMAREVGMDAAQFLEMIKGFMAYADKFGS